MVYIEKLVLLLFISGVFGASLRDTLPDPDEVDKSLIVVDDGPEYDEETYTGDESYSDDQMAEEEEIQESAVPTRVHRTDRQNRRVQKIIRLLAKVNWTEQTINYMVKRALTFIFKKYNSSLVRLISSAATALQGSLA